MEKVFNWVSFFLILLFFSFCDNGEQYSESNIQEDFSIKQWAEDSYFIDLRSLFVSDSQVYMVDYELNKVFAVSEDGNKTFSWGDMGRGPGELLGAIQTFEHLDSLYVYSGSNNRIEVFCHNHHQRTIDLTGIRALNYGGRFSVDDDYIYMSFPQLQGSISKLSMKGDEISILGELKSFPSERQTLFQNHRNVFLDQSSVIAVPFSLPYVERYNTSGELLEKLSYEHLPFLQERIQEANMNLHKENLVVNYISDAYFADGMLYLLMVYVYNEKVFSDKVLVVDLTPGKMKIEKVLNLSEGWHSALAVSQQFLWTVKRNPEGLFLTRYSIDDTI